jgi:hypothetical protein
MELANSSVGSSVQEEPLKKLSQRELQEFIRRTEEKYNKLNETLTQQRQAKSEGQANICTFKPLPLC